MTDADTTDQPTPQVLSTTTAASPMPDTIAPTPSPATAPVFTPPPPPPVDTTAATADDFPEYELFGSGDAAEIPLEGADGGPAVEHVEYTADVAGLQTANAEPAVWAHEVYELVGHVTGKWIDESLFLNWFEAFGKQVQNRTVKELVFRLANTEVPSHVDGDPALNLLDFRNDLAAGIRRAAGLQ